MEAARAIEIFSSLVLKYNLRYAKYLGDGDTNSFTKVVQSKPYGDSLIPGKLECIGYYQKQLGNRCRQLRKELKSEILSDGEKICGKRRLIKPFKIM